MKVDTSIANYGSMEIHDNDDLQEIFSIIEDYVDLTSDNDFKREVSSLFSDLTDVDEDEMHDIIFENCDLSVQTISKILYGLLCAKCDNLPLIDRKACEYGDSQITAMKLGSIVINSSKMEEVSEEIGNLQKERNELDKKIKVIDKQIKDKKYALKELISNV